MAPRKDPVKAQIDHVFRNDPTVKRLAMKWHRELPDGRHKSLALTALQEAVHWAAEAAADPPEWSAVPAETPAPSGKAPKTGGTKVSDITVPTAKAVRKKAEAAKKTAAPRKRAAKTATVEPSAQVVDIKARRVVRPS